MKKVKMNCFLVLFLLGITIIANGQSSNEWQLILNNHSALKIKMLNNEMTFIFNYENDTLTFSHANKKVIKAGFLIEVVLKNNNKVVFTSNDKNLNYDKTSIVIPMADVYTSMRSMKVPSKPKYMMSIKDKSATREKLFFEFSDK